MDYLTILSTRSLVLFPDATSIAIPSKPIHNRTHSSSSSITTPTSSILLLPPTPISMPISSLLYDDTTTAYFLVQHVLSSSGIASPTVEHDLTIEYGSGLGGMNISKEVMAEAEVMVWKEMDKAKMFVRELGTSFGQDQGVAGDKALRELASKHGLGLKDESEHEHEHSHTSEHEHALAQDTLVDGVVQLNVRDGGIMV